MSHSLYLLVMTAHVLGMVLWISGLTAIFWMLRFHDHAPKSSHEALTLQERALALATDIAAAVTIGCGLAMVFSPGPGLPNLFVAKPNVWLHIKLTAVVLLILPVHGILRGRIKKYSQGILKPVPTWLWSMLLGGIAIAIFAVVTKLQVFPKDTDSTPPAATMGSAAAVPAAADTPK
ncbi:MAG: CopD family protein [Kofleriaceae bacterium]